MAFKLDLSPSYRWPVSFTITGEDGAPTPCVLELDFKRLKQSELEELIKQLTSDDSRGRLADRDFCLAHVLGWHGVKDNEDKDLAFSIEGLLTLLEIVGVQGAIVRAYFDSVKVGQEKNSQPQPEPGLTLPPG